MIQNLFQMTNKLDKMTTESLLHCLYQCKTKYSADDCFFVVSQYQTNTKDMVTQSASFFCIIYTLAWSMIISR